MSPTRMLAVLGLVNLVGLGALATSTARAVEAPGIVRARAIELVDEQGRVRSRLEVLPSGVSAGGVAYPETVILRLITEDGKPRIKMTTSMEGSGLMLLGSTDETYVRVGAKGAESGVTMIEAGGERSEIGPRDPEALWKYRVGVERPRDDEGMADLAESLLRAGANGEVTLVTGPPAPALPGRSSRTRTSRRRQTTRVRTRSPLHLYGTPPPRTEIHSRPCRSLHAPFPHARRPPLRFGLRPPRHHRQDRDRPRRRRARGR